MNDQSKFALERTSRRGGGGGGGGGGGEWGTCVARTANNGHGHAVDEIDRVAKVAQLEQGPPGVGQEAVLQLDVSAGYVGLYTHIWPCGHSVLQCNPHSASDHQFIWPIAKGPGYS